MAENDEQRSAENTAETPASPAGWGKPILVVAVGGDKIVGMQGRLLVNGSQVELPTSACGSFVARAPSDFQPPPDVNKLRVPANQFFVVGDDLNNSYDSRFYGAIDVRRLRGKPLYLYRSRKTTRIACAVK